MGAKSHSMTLLFFAAVLCLAVQANITLPLYHPHPEQLQQGSHESHQASYVIYHDLRNIQSHHLRHELHLTAAKQTYGIISMGYFFTLPLTIAGMQYNLNIDTGSSDIFIKGEQSKGAPTQKYSCHICMIQNPKYVISYLDGSLMTYLKKLPVRFGQHQFEERILVAYDAPKTFEKPQGLVGLSFPALARNPNPNFIQTLINNKIVDKYAFGVNLNFQNNHSSSITFGEPNKDLYHGQLKMVKLIAQTSYRIPVDSIQVGDGAHLSVRAGLLDTGNSCISIPSRHQMMILNQFNNAGIGYNKCAFDREPFAPMFSLLRCRVKDFNRLPVLKIYIEGDKFEIDKDAYVQRCVWEGSDSLCDFYIESSTYGYEMLIGDGFFSRYYTYFDIENKEVGFARNKEEISYKNMYKPHSALDNEDKQFFGKLK